MAESSGKDNGTVGAGTASASRDSAFEPLWVLFKGCLSAFLLFLAFFVPLTNLKSIGDPGMWFFFATMVMFAAAPWVDYKRRPSRALGLGAVFLAVLNVSFALKTAFDTPFPRDCAARTAQRACLLENALYSVGGTAAAAGMWIFVAVALLYFACLAFKHHRRAAEPERKER